MTKDSKEGGGGAWNFLGSIFNSFGFVGQILLLILIIFFLMGDAEQKHWLVDFVSFQSESVKERLIFVGIIALLGVISVINTVRERNSRKKTELELEKLNRRLTLPGPKTEEFDLNKDRPEPQRGESPPEENTI